MSTRRGQVLHVAIGARKGARAVCSGCFKKGRGYDTLARRLFTFVPLWGIAVFLAYAMRRVDCRRCGVTVELVPWASGKSHTTHAFVCFIASRARALPWAECGRRFASSWDTVLRGVEEAVRWGLEHRNLDGIHAIGVDELAWKKVHKSLTLVYQLDHRQRRLLHIAKERTTASFNSFFDMLGQARSLAIIFVASDMWRAFLNVVRRLTSAIHVLDRFHVGMRCTSPVLDVLGG